MKTQELRDCLLADTEELITEEAIRKSSAKILPPKTILMAMYGATVGQLGVLTKPMACNQACAAMVVDSTKADYRYLYYQLLAARSQIQSAATGAAQQNLSGTQIKSFSLPFPPLAVQTTIADYLWSLDRRIDLLRATNATLEAIAQGLFKSWFVDFDPVRAKAEGRNPDGMDESTAAMFPDTFEESELGPVPRSWRTKPIYDFASYINGAAYKAFSPNLERDGLPIIKIAELKSGVTSQTAYSNVEMPEKYRVEGGDILFSWSGNPDTSIDTFVWTHDAGWLNQHIFKVVPANPVERAFVLQTLKHLRPTFAELARNKQTTGLGHVTVSDMKQLKAVYPDTATLALFAEVVGPIQGRVFENQRHAQTLATLRDTLLPRLISGQLRLPEAEAAIEEASA